MLNQQEVEALRTEIWEIGHELSRILRREVMVAGGAVRDLFFGRRPKDLDVFVLGEGPIAAGDELEEATAALAWVLRGAGVGVRSIHNSYRDSASARLDYVLEVKHRGWDIDIICYSESYGDERMVRQVQEFDANCNALYLDPLTGAYCLSPEFVEFLRTRTIKNLKYCDGVVSSRLAYLADKFNGEFQTMEVQY